MNTNTKIAVGICILVALIGIVLLVKTAKAPSPEDAANAGGNVATSTLATNASTTSSVSSSTKPVTPVKPGTGTGTKPTTPAFTKADDSKATDQGVADLVTANNAFALDMYVKLGTDSANLGKNIFLSPYSISTALSMVHEGARGKTAAEMEKVLHIAGDMNIRRSAQARTYNELNAPNNSFTLRTANALWAEKTYAFVPAYLKTVASYYQGNVANLDFKQNAEVARTTINAWVERQTNNKIVNLIPAGAVDLNTRLVLTNAIYFKGKWALQFDSKKTKKADFHVSTSTIALVDMMSNTDGKMWNYAESPAGQILELPYMGDKLSMLVVLQKKSTIQSSDIADLQDGMAKQKVNVYLPRFKLETSYSLNTPLTDLGMPTAFGAFADFSGMSAANDLKISAVLHKAFVEVNEEGTEAAAATGVVMTTTSVEIPAPIPEFKADRPFLFMIQNTKTGEILFIGKVVNPNQ